MIGLSCGHQGHAYAKLANLPFLSVTKDHVLLYSECLLYKFSNACDKNILKLMGLAVEFAMLQVLMCDKGGKVVCSVNLSLVADKIKRNQMNKDLQ